MTRAAEHGANGNTTEYRLSAVGNIRRADSDAR